MKNLNTLVLFLALLGSTFLTAQDNVGIGTTTPEPTAALDVQSNDKGVLVPRLTTAQRTGIASPAEGLMVYDTDEECFFYFKASTNWESLCASGTGSGTSGPHNTLNQAYNEGGAGAGRVITANNGSVEINHTSIAVDNKALMVNTNQTQSFGIDATNTGTGVSVRARNTNAANTFSALQAETNSSDANTSAIIGSNSGAGYGVSGQIPASATGSSAVYGNNLRTTGGSGVRGEGVNGVVGFSNTAAGYGVYGNNTATGNSGSQTTLAIGTYGIGFVGVYGQTTDPTNGWTGYFTGDIGVDGGVYAIGPGNFNLSDGRLKSNVVPIEGALEKIMKLKPKHYTIKTKSVPNLEEGKVVEDSRQEYGVIAQELEKVFPGMISEKAFFKSSGDNTEYKSVNYVQLIPVLIEAIKELKTEVDVLKERLEDTNNR